MGNAEYDEALSIAVCKRHGIEMVEKKGMPIYKGKEMSKDFWLEDLFEVEPEIVETKSFSINLSLPFDPSLVTERKNVYVDELTNIKCYPDETYSNYVSKISDNKILSKAA